jgi:hypothetical protein
MTDPAHCFVGRKKTCGHVYAASVDDGSKRNPEFVADIVRAGNVLERVTVEDARGATWCTCKRRKGNGL